MLFNDFDVLWRAAQALLQGHDPYALYGVYYPLPLFFIFVPLAVLPLPVAHLIWTALEGIIFVAILRRAAAMSVLFMPVVLTFLMGQIVMPMLGLFALLRSGFMGGVVLALLWLKPQLVFFLTPWLLWRWWKTDRRQIVWFVFTLMALAVISFIIQPDWLIRWLAVSGERNRAPIAPSIWGVLSFLTAPLWLLSCAAVTTSVFVWAWRTNNFDLIAVAGFLVNPLVISYDLTLFTLLVRDARIWLVLTLLSWISFAISAWELNERAFVLATLAIFIFVLFEKRQRVAQSVVRQPEAAYPIVASKL